MPDLKNISLKWKTALPIIILVALGVIMTIFVTGYETQKLALDQERESTLHGYRDTVLNALTTMMMAGGNFNQQEANFLGQMGNIADVKVIRGDGVSGQYGAGSGSVSPDSVDDDVLKTGIEKVVIDGDYIRGVYPYVASSNYMGRNCLSCHNVKQGDVLGVVSIKAPLKASFDRIRSLQGLFALLGLLGILALGGITFSIVERTHRPLGKLIEELKDVAAQNSGMTVLEEKGGDEIIRLTKSVYAIIRVFSDMVNSIMLSTSKILPVIDILGGMSEKTSEGARKQSMQAVQIATAAEEMSQTISEIAKSTSRAA
nr:methyl-accepting chemotaxis protein [Nitrospiraceae bacterium]